MARRLYSKKHKKIDTVAASKREFEPEWNGFRREYNVLYEASKAWDALDQFREIARRNKMYTFGDQWGDKICFRGKMMTERESILSQGNIPLSNNRIRGIVRSIVGLFQSQKTEPLCVARDRKEQKDGEIMSTAVQYVYQANRLWDLDSFNLQLFLVVGLAAFRSSYGWRRGKMDVWTDAVNHNRIFLDNYIQDSRHWDCSLIGEIHDVGLYDVIAQFGNGNPERERQIRDIYRMCGDREHLSGYVADTITEDRNYDLNFFIPLDANSRCRVIEVWRKEAKERLLVHDWLTGDYYKEELSAQKLIDAENEMRIQTQSAAGVQPEEMKLVEYNRFIDQYWYFYFLAPTGEVLSEGETPYWHGSHPYTFKIHSFFDGQVSSFVSGFIDQQRFINRLIILQDFVTRSSAKGVLLVPKEAIPEGSSIEDFADVWAEFNGTIAYVSKNGVPPPQQVVSNATKADVTQMLQIQLKLLEDISGVQGALQGKSPNSGTPAALYMQQVQQATTSLTEVFEAYKELREERDTKNMKLIQQYYDKPRYLNIVGQTDFSMSYYDPSKVRNAEYDLTIIESQNTPMYRMINNELLMQLFQTQAIDLKQLLELGSFPFSDKLLQKIEINEQKAAEAMAAQQQAPQAPINNEQLNINQA
jgi:hypothetical protein